MKLFKVSAVILVGLVTLHLVEACGPHQRLSYNHSFEFTNTNQTKELGCIPISSAVRLGALRGLRESEKLFNESWLVNWPFIKERVDPELPVFVNTTFPRATRQAALIHAISSAAIAYELTLKCRHNIRGCKCARHRDTGRDGDGCGGHNFEFGQTQTRRFFKKLEKGNGARTAVNLHNNKVGRKVVQTSRSRLCKCHGVATACYIKTCYMILASFEKITAELKKKYAERAVQVWFMDNKLHEQIGDQFKPISSEDTRLVYLDHTPVLCVRNDSLGTPGMLGRTCHRNSILNDSDCQIFRAICTEHCNLNYMTAVEYVEENCDCKFQWCCSIKCQKCTRPTPVPTCVANNDNLEARRH